MIRNILCTIPFIFHMYFLQILLQIKGASFKLPVPYVQLPVRLKWNLHSLNFTVVIAIVMMI